ncbi:unnamed protein product, partial [Polarella glacialis]
DKKFGAHNERNQGPILEKLLQYLPQCSAPKGGASPLQVLEVASGTGQHAAFFSGALHNVIWQPSDYDPRCLKSIDMWTSALRDNIRCAVELDVTKDSCDWPLSADSFDVIFNCNMIHLAPIQVMQGLCAGAGVVAKAGAKLFLYGPFTEGGKHVSESNAAFDGKMRSRDPSWGVRAVEDVQLEMAKHGFSLLAKELMPANNFLLVFTKSVSGV